MSAAVAEQTVAAALVAILDTLPAIVALTGHASGNLRPVDDAGRPRAVGLTYDLGPTTVADGLGENWDVGLTVFAEAPTRGVVRALLSAVEGALTPMALLAAGADALVLEPESQGVGRADSPHAPDGQRPPETYAGAWDCRLWITLPA